MNETLTALKGVRVGHATDETNLTGVTAVLFDSPAPVAYVCNGGSPGTYNTDPLKTEVSGVGVHAIFVSGGSWTGLQSGGVITEELIKRNVGYKTYKIVNPFVTGAIVLDLGTSIKAFDPDLAKQAVRSATPYPVERGNVGAGTGTSVGKFRYFDNGTTPAPMKAGVGCALVELPNGVKVSCLSVVNALGNIVGHDGSVIAGNRKQSGDGFETFDEASDYYGKTSNTTISIVGTNAKLGGRNHYLRVAQQATHGQVRAIDPVNLAIDGDTVFVFSTEEIDNIFDGGVGDVISQTGWADVKVDVIGQAAARAVRESIYDACKSAQTIQFDSALEGVIPSHGDY